MLDEKDVIQKIKMREIDLTDDFFDSLRDDYSNFDRWAAQKSGEDVYVLYQKNKILGFLLLKDETEEDTSIYPVFIKKRRLKISTFKIESHGTVLGQRFMSVILTKMIEDNFQEVYVTVMGKHNGLIALLQKYGFEYWGIKDTDELVYVKNRNIKNDIYLDFPMINLSDNSKYLLSIWPQFHTKMFPYSKLRTEKNHQIEDLSVTNTIEKIYLTKMNGVQSLKIGDLLLIYRTKSETSVSARYSSVATSICTVVEQRNINEFNTMDDYLSYCGKGSIFSDEELISFYKTKKYPYIIKMLYNLPLKKRIVRDNLINEIGLDEEEYFGFMELEETQFEKILEIGGVDEGFILN